jgi:hypothetical protein
MGFALPSLPAAEATATALVPSTFLYTFNDPGVLHASVLLKNSTSPYFWISSGGRMSIANGIGQTIQGYLPTGDLDQVNYALVNPLDTGNGHYPQNTFRLITRSLWGNAEEEVKFKITKTNLTNTPNRDGYSGIFLYSRYNDKDDLYYAGVRQDGLAIIKKKIGSVYHSLIYKQAFGYISAYDKNSNPNLMPENQWMGLKLKTTNNADGSVHLELLIDKQGNGVWTSLLVYNDKGVGGTPFRDSGYGGIRTDYMDVQFDNFKIKAL